MSNSNQGLGPDRVTIATKTYPMPEVTEEDLKRNPSLLQLAYRPLRGMQVVSFPRLSTPYTITDPLMYPDKLDAFVMLDSQTEVYCFSDGYREEQPTTFFKTPLTKLRTKKI